MMTNRRVGSWLVAFFAVAFLFLQSAPSFGADDKEPPIPHFTSPVYDETNTLTSSQKAALEQRLYYLADSTSTQIQIAILKTTSGVPINEFAVTVGQANHIGQAKKNNGALIMLAKDDHHGFIATGYGLEPTLTDATLSLIYQDILRPHLKDGDFYGGLDSTITVMIQAINGEFKAQSGDKLPTRGVSIGRRGRSGNGSFFFVIALFVIFIIIRAIAGTGIRRTIVGAGGGGSGCLGGILQGLFWSSIFNSGNRGGGGFFGGGGSGGSGGGFSGWSGGGGSFGGGGAGGDW